MVGASLLLVQLLEGSLPLQQFKKPCSTLIFYNAVHRYIVPFLYCVETT